MSPKKLIVLAPAAFSSPLTEVAEKCKIHTGTEVIFNFGPASGDAPSSVTSRLRRGDHADMAILPRDVLETCVTSGHLDGEGVTHVMRSSIGVCVRAGTGLPDIADVAALTDSLLQSRSIAVSTAGSGLYVSKVLFDKLGISERIRDKCFTYNEPIGAVVARGDAELGFQQIVELLEADNIELVGALPEEVQKYTTIAAAYVDASRDTTRNTVFMDFLISTEAKSIFNRWGVAFANNP